MEINPTVNKFEEYNKTKHLQNIFYLYDNMSTNVKFLFCFFRGFCLFFVKTITKLGVINCKC